MSTREKIEAAERRCERALDRGGWNSGLVGEYRSGKENWIADCALLARERIIDRQQRERDQQPPTREMLSAIRNRICVERWWLLERWDSGRACPICDASSDRIKLDTIAKLRAACLLLGIETEGIL